MQGADLVLILLVSSCSVYRDAAPWSQPSGSFSKLVSACAVTVQLEQQSATATFNDLVQLDGILGDVTAASVISVLLCVIIPYRATMMLI